MSLRVKLMTSKRLKERCLDLKVFRKLMPSQNPSLNKSKINNLNILIFTHF
jgi:hypothetical protein